MEADRRQQLIISFPLMGKDKGRGDPSPRFVAPLSRPFPVKGKGVGRSNRLRFHFSVGERKIMNHFVEVGSVRWVLFLRNSAI
jgi:hypothetical protein